MLRARFPESASFSIRRGQWYTTTSLQALSIRAMHGCGRRPLMSLMSTRADAKSLLARRAASTASSQNCSGAVLLTMSNPFEAGLRRFIHWPADARYVHQRTGASLAFTNKKVKAYAALTLSSSIPLLCPVALFEFLSGATVTQIVATNFFA